MLIETDYRALTHAGQEGLPFIADGTVVAIGNFDGVHLGHQALLAQARQIADVQGLKLVVLTFSPHPRVFFQPDQPPFMLMDIHQKYDALTQAGADVTVSVAFDAALCGLSAEAFIQEVLCHGLGTRHVVVGDNFVFGHKRSGCVATLQEAGQKLGFDVTALKMVTNQDEVRVSSERIRSALRAGQVEEAQTLLGRPWQLRGMVIKGNQQGREWGFPTANIGLGSFIYPAFGVYAAKVSFEGEGATHLAAVNIGQRPTIGISGPLLEAHLLDFSGDLYGKIMRVDLLHFLRPEQKFANFDELKQQIQKDVIRIGEIFAGEALESVT